MQSDESASSCTVCSRCLVFAAVLSRCLSWRTVAVLGVNCNVAMSELARRVFVLCVRDYVFAISELTRPVFAMLGARPV